MLPETQLSFQFPDSQTRPTPRETLLVGFGDDESPPDADCEDWSLPLGDDEGNADVTLEAELAFPDRIDETSRPDADDDYWRLPLSDEENKADVLPAVDWAIPDGVDQMLPPEPGITGAASTPPFQPAVPAPFVAGWNVARRRAKGTSRRRRPPRDKGLLIWTLCIVSFFAGLQLFTANFTVPPVARQDPPKAVDLPLMPNPLSVAIAKQYEEVIKRITQNTQPAAPAAVQSATPVAVRPAEPVAANAPLAAKAPARPNDAKPESTASLYARVRQVVLENKTEETDRVGMGDVAYQNVPDDGSIMVGMAVTYAPFFTHQVIKSVRPIYQRSDGTRYDGPVCGTSTGVGERVVAREGYAIGGAAIKSGMGIDGMQLTFMEIGADGLNPNKTYLSKWLGGYGGANAKTFVNDGRPIVGIVGMWSRNNFGPAFCLGLVTTRSGALADADGREMMQTQPEIILLAPMQPQIIRVQQ